MRCVKIPESGRPSLLDAPDDERGFIEWLEVQICSHRIDIARVRAAGIDLAAFTDEEGLVDGRPCTAVRGGMPALFGTAVVLAVDGDDVDGLDEWGGDSVLGSMAVLPGEDGSPRFVLELD